MKDNGIFCRMILFVDSGTDIFRCFLLEIYGERTNRMKLTKTQRNFRKQINGLSRSATPYDNSRDGNPFYREHKPKIKSSSFFLLIFLALIIVFAYKNWPKVTSNSLTSSSAVSMVQSSLVKQTALPASETLIRLYLHSMRAISIRFNLLRPS